MFFRCRISQAYDFDKELWKPQLGELKKNRKYYQQIDNMSSRDSFRVMEQFAETVDDAAVRKGLFRALEGHKPFANFNVRIDDSGDYRQQWFSFRLQKMIEWVERQLEQHDPEEDETASGDPGGD